MAKEKELLVHIENTLAMKEKRKEAINRSKAKPLPFTYKVNELAKELHPGFIKAKIIKIETLSHNTKKFTFKSLAKNGRFPYFRAGQYVTITTKVGNSLVTRPYSIFSSPNEALEGILELAITDCGLLSTYLCTKVKVGHIVLVSEPCGDFHYDDIRDRKHIVGIAGGTGVTPFVSMIKAIIEGSEHFKFTLLYGVNTYSDLLIDVKKINHPLIKTAVIVEKEDVDGCYKGLITKDILKKYVTKDSSVFMCGAKAMYDFVRDELKNIGLEDVPIREEKNTIVDLDVKELKTYDLIVRMKNDIYKIKARNNETLLVAMERAGLAAPNRCRIGKCGFCHSRLINGEIYVREEDEFRRGADFKFNYIHPCCSYPKSDIEIEVPVVEELKEV